LDNLGNIVGFPGQSDELTVTGKTFASKQKRSPARRPMMSEEGKHGGYVRR
jgi:hypothetical protein